MAKAKLDVPAAPWAANQIERRAIVSLMGWDGNARTHSDEQIDQLVESITTFGFTNPVLVDAANTIIAGHGRVLAATKLGLTHVPVVVVPDTWSEDKKRAYVLADNKLALNADWDVEALSRELASLKAAEAIGNLDFAFGVVGFSDDDLARLLDDSSQTELRKIADEVEDEREAPVVGAAAGDETTSFSTPLTHAEATVVHSAIRQAKREGNYQTTGETLAAICREWVSL